MLRTIQHWIATKWLEIDQDNLHMKFYAFNVDFSSSSPDPIGSRRPAQGGYFTAMLSRVLWALLKLLVAYVLLGFFQW